MGKSYSGSQKAHTWRCSTAVPLMHWLQNSKLLTTSSNSAMGTKKGTFTLMPLPKIEELFALLKGAKYLTVLDLWSGYYHIKLDEESILKSALTTVFRKSEVLRLLFCVSQGPNFYIHPIYDFFGLDKVTMQGQGCGYMAYFNDILIYSRTEKGHHEILDNGFKHLLKAWLKIKLSKCSFFKEQIHYLSHLVSGLSILQLYYKIEALVKLKLSQMLKKLYTS